MGSHACCTKKKKRQKVENTDKGVSFAQGGAEEEEEDPKGHKTQPKRI